MIIGANLPGVGVLKAPGISFEPPHGRRRDGYRAPPGRPRAVRARRPTVAGVTEVIVRELRLRGYEHVQHVVPAHPAAPAHGAHEGALRAREAPVADRLARRHSRRRDHDVALGL
ncbi:MAG: hypothetical protein JF886_01970 [Candidatus Dormibacteraeota bacterium]|uniref:Uncharacterized protein n=1 Tax=Candidatus Aeolococcus gillhamiae TaxID=3127015 RepID=A0A2W5YYC4_9BACT|nr:hypothetical protein [Candidatus Dormibacteraeota bacterium]PZR77963.1 MAG: hypothetical protein DLM65_14370 [Candidatus Dormibacter sp. RRmetagenome_bin12]